MRGAYSSILSVRGFSAALAVVLLIIPSTLRGQSYRGSIRGEVTDPSGAVVPNAKVTVKGTANGANREVRSGADGVYVVAELPAGSYDISVEVPGFQITRRTGAVVEVGRDTTVDMRMILHGADVVTVNAAPPLVEATRDVLGEVVDQKLVSELPLSGRDFGKLVALVPGATVEPSGVAAVQSGLGQFSINGNRDRSNNYTLDGTDNNDPFFNNSALNQTGIGGAPASLLPIDAIQEFNLQSQAPAEYGRNSGSVINILTKSGTNQLHGTAFEFLRNNALDACNYFNRAPAKQTAFRNNQFGGSLGGPIIKDKTFFFGAYEGQRERVGSDFTFLVPTPQSILLGQQLAVAQGITTPNPALTKVLGFFPSPVSTSDGGLVGSLPGTVADKNDGNNLIAKIDHQISASESLTGRYAFSQSTQVFPLGNLGSGAASRLAQFAQTSPARVQVISASLLSTFSSSRINEVRFGYSRYRTSFEPKDAAFDPKSIGIDFGTGKLSLPEIDFGGTFENLGASAFLPHGRTSGSFQFLDNFTWVRGRHTIKFGGEVRRIIIDSFNDGLSRGQIEFSSSTFGPPNSVCPFTGAAASNCSDSAVTTLANFYLGKTSSVAASAGNTQRTTYNNGLSFFAQDDFRATPTLILNLGLRWEYFGPLSEAHNLLSNLGRDGHLAMVGSDGVDGAYARDLNNFGPRFGFAWSARPSTVVRGGYGIYYDYVPQDLLIANFTSSAGLVTNPIGPVSSAVVPFNYSAVAFNGTTPGPVFTPNTTACAPPNTCPIFVTPRNFPNPYSQTWNVNVEQQVVSTIAFQLGYVGSKGTKLVRLLDINQANSAGIRPNSAYSAMDSLSPVSASTYHALQATLRTRDWHGLSGFAGYTFSKSLDDASDGIDYNFATVAFPQNSFDLHADHGPSNFDARHRFTAAFTYLIPRFAGPRMLTAGWQLNAIVTLQSGRPVPIVSSNDTSGQAFDQSPSPSNFHQRPDLIPGVNPINSNWQSAPDTVGYLNGNAFAQPLDATPANLVGSFGNLQRNGITGPHFRTFDFALAKNTQITERVNLQLRAEFFNIFNHPNFALPNFFVSPAFNADGSSTGASPTQGLITQTPDQAQTNPGLGGGGPRVIQLGVKFLF